MTAAKTEKDEQKKEGGGIFGLRKPAQEKKGRFVTVKEEKKTLKRVVKAKPMARKHMADALKPQAVNEDAIRITEKVMQTVAAPPRPKPAASFTCFQCGAQVRYDSDRCPKCKSFYIRDVTDEDMEELTRAEQTQDGLLDDIVEREGSPVVHFDAETGVMHFLEDDHSDPDFVFECTHCGTLVELNTDRCPICGTKLELGDTGLVGIFTDMEFDTDPLEEMDCPFCGDHVSFHSGSCPACGKDMDMSDDRGQVRKVRPILRADNVVFLHLDIITGEVNFLQRNVAKRGYDQLSVQLDGIGSNGFEQDWSSLSRI